MFHKWSCEEGPKIILLDRSDEHRNYFEFDGDHMERRELAFF